MIGETVTIERPGEQDDFGDRGAGTTFDLENCVIAPAGTGLGTERPSAGGTTSVTDRTVYVAGPGHPDVKGEDRVKRADGSTWQVIGRPHRWTSPFTGEDKGIEFDIRIRTGG